MGNSSRRSVFFAHITIFREGFYARSPQIQSARAIVRKSPYRFIFRARTMRLLRVRAGGDFALLTRVFGRVTWLFFFSTVKNSVNLNWRNLKIFNKCKSAAWRNSANFLTRIWIEINQRRCMEAFNYSNARSIRRHRWKKFQLICASINLKRSPVLLECRKKFRYFLSDERRISRVGSAKKKIQDGFFLKRRNFLVVCFRLQRLKYVNRLCADRGRPRNSWTPASRRTTTTDLATACHPCGSADRYVYLLYLKFKFPATRLLNLLLLYHSAVQG